MELQTLGQAHRLDLILESNGKAPVQLRGRDYYQPSTQYFRLILPAFKGKRAFSIPMGISPLRLNVESNSYLKSATLAFQPVLSKKQQEAYQLPSGRTLKNYLDFVTQFAQKANYLKEGVHTSEKDNFAILYEDKVQTIRTKEFLFTPMLVNKINGDVQASKNYFRHPEVSVFVIICQFLHELGHYDLATKDEMEADRYGAALFLALGYPAFSIIHSMDSMIYRYQQEFNETPYELYQRRIALISYLKQQ